MKIRVFLIISLVKSCPRELLNDPDYIDRVLRSAAVKAKLRLLSTHVKKFEPQGVTGVAIIGESHIAVHTWPQNGNLFVDIATCSTKETALAAFSEVIAHFPGGKTISYQEIEVTDG